jgi:hypothetical protein
MVREALSDHFGDIYLVLERGRMRVMGKEQAKRFWREWWEARQKQKQGP